MAKVASLRASGHEPFRYTWPRSHEASELQSLHAGLPPGAEAGAGLPGSEVSVAGRVLAIRAFGKLAFLSLADSTGGVQLYVDAARLGVSQGDAGAFERLRATVDVGDIVGGKGTVKRTEKGELSVNCDEVAVLTKALLPLPDKWHGLTDKETRYRQVSRGGGRRALAWLPDRGPSSLGVLLSQTSRLLHVPLPPSATWT